MTWNELAGRIDTIAFHEAAIDVRGVQYDSRRVTAGDVFVAMRGETTDGNRHVDVAIRSGAAAVVTDSAAMYTTLRERQPELALALVERGRRALAEVSLENFGHPERGLKLSAVTGTNGKTTTAFLLEQLLQSVGRKSVLLGTIETHIAGAIRPSEHTTPESRDVIALFAEGVRVGCTEAVMEMSSHALEQERVWGLPVDVAIFTNLTQDHLDYHGTMEAYAAAKAKLFHGVGAAPPRVAVINADDAYSEQMIAAASHSRVITYGLRGDWYPRNVRLSAGHTHFAMRTPESDVIVDTPLTGEVNVYNFLAAACAAHERGLTLEEIAEAAKTLRQVPGRFEVVPESQQAGFTVVVDYAHTDDALRNLIKLARDLVNSSGGRVITLFGCGGDRDTTKRPKMGRAAGEGSDLVFVTSDNPRSEDPASIAEQALAGVRETKVRWFVELDRAKAIARAIGEAKSGDIVLLAGKGHEKTQTFATETVAFDDVAVAGAVLREGKR